MLATNGIPTAEELAPRIPPAERLKKGPVAIIECFQKIPCNPCSTACKTGAIEKFEDINDLPSVDLEKCTGCGLCISKCPGLAIFVVDETYSEMEAAVSLPFEFLPLPAEGEEVDVLDRSGKTVGRGKVIRVRNGKYEDRTPVVTVAVPKELSMVVRNIRVGGDRR
ncbi:4Fe-4S binding protein [Thermosediminibacter litoriperuensis]|uniref:4Fe-4S binding protein n=1 Tax=Thermosediminibacter litoriperuensis TaxID=291989 RepID=A0A5S5APS6_9FIRM|nr:4Fe-4S binding protein [Thermosediminibacter litoriperuensis]TYP53320.1 4Fe-4S binding protein [Thermosediminibacter litoriperuensis]